MHFEFLFTGELDNETLALMNSKRCSLPDKVIGPDGRQKRYLAKGEQPGSVFSVVNYLLFKYCDFQSFKIN